MKRTVEINWRLAWTQRRRIDIPDGLTAAEMDALIEAAVKSARPPKPPNRAPSHEYGASCVPGYVYARPDLEMVPVPEEAWRAVDGRRWATDSACLVCEGGPLPLAFTDGNPGWTLPPETVADLVTLPTPDAPIHPGVFHPRMAPLLAAGRALQGTGREARVVDAGGRVVAVVMPYRGTEPGLLRADGTVPS